MRTETPGKSGFDVRMAHATETVLIHPKKTRITNGF
jgi:hypothetical protein